MPFYRTPDGTNVHINFGGRGNKKAPVPCAARRSDGTQCGWMSGYQCDWKYGGAVCDRYICEAHAFEVGEDKHLCPEHLASYTVWIRDQGIAY